MAQPSCSGLAATCGASGNASCCSSSVVPGGTYNRANDPTYPATVSDFRLDTYEITVGRFRRFVAAYSQSIIPSGAGKNPNNASDPGWDTAWNASLPANAAALTTAVLCDPTMSPNIPTWTSSPGSNENRPMNCISWYVTNAFCIWDGGRLPTEAEWNYAAAGGSQQRPYPWGTTIPGNNAFLAVYECHYGAMCADNTVNSIAPVGSASAGNGLFGQADMAGNLWEWSLDGYVTPYSQATCVNCANTTTGSLRVIRGGSWYHFGGTLLTTFRDGSDPTARSYTAGGRCARAP